MTPVDDISRLRQEYADRKQSLDGKEVYSVFNKANLFSIHQRQLILTSSLKRLGWSRISDLKILEMGCGGGGILTEFLTMGAHPKDLFGVDLLFDRLGSARENLPGCHFINADGQHVPFLPRTFDIVMQYTAISSILDEEIRFQISSDMLRVLKPGGLIISYDFWLNPTNKQTHGIRPAEIRNLFPDCFYEFHKITLAPPIARRIVPVSWILAIFLEKLKIFNSHYLVFIQPH